MAEVKNTTGKPVAKVATKKLAEKKVDRFAVIKTGGKQCLVEEGKYYNFEKIAGEEGKAVNFEEVLLVVNGSNIKIGKPTVKDAKVSGKILSQLKDDKVKVFKFKKRKDYRRTHGHRQELTKVEITKIS